MAATLIHYWENGQRVGYCERPILRGKLRGGFVIRPIGPSESPHKKIPASAIVRRPYIYHAKEEK